MCWQNHAASMAAAPSTSTRPWEARSSTDLRPHLWHLRIWWRTDQPLIIAKRWLQSARRSERRQSLDATIGRVRISVDFCRTMTLRESVPRHQRSCICRGSALVASARRFLRFAVVAVKPNRSSLSAEFTRVDTGTSWKKSSERWPNSDCSSAGSVSREIHVAKSSRLQDDGIRSWIGRDSCCVGGHARRCVDLAPSAPCQVSQRPAKAMRGAFGIAAKGFSVHVRASPS